MSELLKTNGYDIYGCTRKDNPFEMIKTIRPDEIYNFASSSNVFNAWENIDSVFETDGHLPQKILECILKTNKSIKYFQASSCLIFGLNKDGIQNEDTPRCPIHPYGIAKLYADNMVSEFRRVYNIYACSGIFYNHESARRGKDFFSKRICRAAAKGEKIKVGNLDCYRDMGYAPDFMEAVYLMMQNDDPEDYVIGTGQLISMRDFADRCFNHIGLNYKYYLNEDEKLCRKNDTNILKADITKITIDLEWKPKILIDEMIKIMIDYENTI